MKRSRSTVAVLITALVVGASLLASPSGAHVPPGQFDHVWEEHIKPRLAEGGQINRDSNPVDWTRLKNVPTDFADGIDNIGGLATDVDCNGCVGSGDVGNGSIAQADLAFDPATQAELDTVASDLGNLATDDGTINQAGDPVHWTKLDGVPGGFADGSDAIDGGTAFDLTCIGCVGTTDLATDAVTSTNIDDLAVTTSKIDTEAVTSGKILDSTITAADLATDSVSSDEILDATITSDDLATDSVTSGDIFDGTIAAADLAIDSVTSAELADNAVDTAAIQGGAVATQKITANFAVSSIAGTTLTAVGDHMAGGAIVNFSGIDDHRVLLNGQTLIDCSTCSPADSATVTWQLTKDDGATTVGVPTTVTLNQMHSYVVAHATGIDLDASGTESYRLKISVTSITGGAIVNVSNGQLTAVDLGL